MNCQRAVVFERLPVLTEKVTVLLPNFTTIPVDKPMIYLLIYNIYAYV